MKESIVSLASSQTLREKNRSNSKSHSKIIEIVFTKNDSKETLTYIEERAIAPETNHDSDGMIPSKFYKVEPEGNGKRKKISEAQAIKEMMSLIEKCLSSETANVSYAEHRYTSENKVIYSY